MAGTNSWKRPLGALMVASMMSPAALMANDSAGERLTRAVRPGDAVTVTLLPDQKRTQGQVIDVTSCVLTLRRGDRREDIPLSDVKTVRKHPRHRMSSRGFLEAANACEEIGCAPAALAFVGVAAAVDWIGRLAHPPKVVYRARKGDEPQLGCQSPG